MEPYRPRPRQILGHVIGMCGMGVVGGSALGMNAARLGGYFALYGGLSSTFKSALVYARQKEDRWNSILSSTATIGLLSLMHRRGLRYSAFLAMAGGVSMALIEGAMINKAKSAQQQNEASKSQIFGMSVPESSSALEAGSKSRFKGLFGKFRFWRAVPA